ncbi:hypothetical protein AB0N06_36940 [Streptomyces sp. NPDC051020]|uniref:hypothetical protein n=1 Tax=Streptomyces sp. NPDC051020 TaxID=3155409 RepID=UPI00343E666E
MPGGSGPAVECSRTSLLRPGDAERPLSGALNVDVPKTLEATTSARFVLSSWEGTLIAARADRSPRAFEVFFTVVFGQILR